MNSQAGSQIETSFARRMGAEVISSLGVSLQNARDPNVDDRFQNGILLLFNTPVSYATGWILQSRLHQERLLNKRPDTIIILEHDPVYTMGRSTRPDDRPTDERILRATGADVQVVNRGGSATFHGPGQVVVYPVLKVTTYAAGPKRLVWLLEEVILRLLARWNIEGYRLAQKPGVWVLSPFLAKIASIGVRIQQGVSLHGFALNVDMDLSPFGLIRPCGLADCRMTTMSHLGVTGLSVATVKRDLAELFSEVFGIEWTTTVQIPDDQTAAFDERSWLAVSHA
ncbi:MAG: lipoyl(octanoyl) transferase LipB [Nitrospira sp.]|nr:lipoyl(octanoyl) transferase LipB [Nitrospira sp.]MCP9441655.1 lipoyl(octanoyl) transferase LipB [Nitrospira sp.]